MITCNHCQAAIATNTNSKMIYCECERVAVDGNEHYCRVIGDAEDYTWDKEDEDGL